MTRPPAHRSSLVFWWVAFVLSMAVIGAMVLGCRAIWIRAGGDVSVNTAETETRSQTAGTNGHNRNVETDLDISP